MQQFTAFLSRAAAAVHAQCVRAAMNTTFRLSFVAVMSVVAVIACDSVPLTSPTGSTISLSMDRTILPLGGQATVTAVVTFNPSIGSVSPVDARTVNGVATATFLAGTQSGVGFIHAFSGAARTGSGNSSSGGVEVRIGAAATGAISVSATPSSVSQSGGTVTISALVMDGSNNPLPGVSVLFTTTAGSLNSTTATTDSSGIARTTLTTTQTARVTANSGAVSSAVDVGVSAAPNVTLTVPASGTVGVPVAMSIAPQGGGAGNTSPRQLATVVVNFGDGTAQTFSNITGTTGFTHTYTQANGYTVSATATDVAGNTGITSSPIVVSRSQPTVTLTAPATVDMSDTGGVAGFTVAASAAAGQPPIQSVTVRLGDGTVIFSGSGGGSFTYQFTSTGTYAVNATATDQAGGVATASGIVRVVP